MSILQCWYITLKCNVAKISWMEDTQDSAKHIDSDHTEIMRTVAQTGVRFRANTHRTTNIVWQCRIQTALVFYSSVLLLVSKNLFILYCNVDIPTYSSSWLCKRIIGMWFLYSPHFKHLWIKLFMARFINKLGVTFHVSTKSHLIS